MERHTTWQRLGTYTVDGKMVQNVTDFIQTRLPRILHFGDEPAKTATSPSGKVAPPSANTAAPSPAGEVAPSAPKAPHSFYDDLSLSIYGSDNSMIYKPVSKYTQSTFNNDIQVLSIELAYKDEGKMEDAKAIVLVLRFGHTSDDSELSIALQDYGAKEKVLAIEDALLRTLEPNRNMNRIAYPNDFVPTLIFVVGFIIGLGGLMFENPLLRSLCAIIFGTAIYFVAHRFIKGYCSFESNYQRRLDIVLNWLTGAVALFVITIIVRAVILKN